MPLTRAISARLRSSSHRQSAPDNQNEDVMMLKSQAKAAAANLDAGLGRTLVAGALAQLNVENSSKGSSSQSTSSSASTTTSTPSRPRYMRGSSRFSSRSSISSRRSMLGSSEFGDSSDDENDSQSSSRRLGGCVSRPSVTNQPDDSNKENVAPFRCTSLDVLESEARDAQEEDAIRRTTVRSRRSSLMERQTFTPSSTQHSRLSRSSTTTDLSNKNNKNNNTTLAFG
ncbi:uncharacterized protein UTRI_04331 [Ustilago trichophora]|uniref:Uncharacterized protein n=1 Tax=Ustilago trichophora TaxID=86804 RepID=A0A5C3ES24_9BASI|nr:uncharacterized protein UTRI_04331 [Ustilago trichophora]